MSRTIFALLAGALVFLSAPSGTADAGAGKGNYDALCASCHGTTGKGDGPVGKSITPPPRDFEVGDYKFDADKNGTPGEDADLKLVIKNGAMPYGGNPVMMAWDHLGEADLDNLIAYLRSLKK